VRFMSQNLAVPVKATGKQLTMIASFPPVARMEVE
jgi:hypothetical protein